MTLEAYRREKKVQREQFNVCVIPPGEWMVAAGEEVPGRLPVRYALEWPLGGPGPSLLTSGKQATGSLGG